MGYYRTKQDIAKRAINLFSLIPSAESSTVRTPTESKASEVVSSIIAEETEKFAYPFSIQYFRLLNPIQDDTELFDESRVYIIPSDIARIVGIFTKESLPKVPDIVNSFTEISNLSVGYSLFGSERVFVDNLEDELYLVYMSNNPPVPAMFTQFQVYVAYAAAAEMAYNFHTNSRIISQAKFEARRKLSIARKLAVTAFSSSPFRFVTIDTILNQGKPDGTV